MVGGLHDYVSVLLFVSRSFDMVLARVWGLVVSEQIACMFYFYFPSNQNDSSSTDDLKYKP